MRAVLFAPSSGTPTMRWLVSPLYSSVEPPNVPCLLSTRVMPASAHHAIPHPGSTNALMAAARRYASSATSWKSAPTTFAVTRVRSTSACADATAAAYSRDARGGAVLDLLHLQDPLARGGALIEYVVHAVRHRVDRAPSYGCVVGLGRCSPRPRGCDARAPRIELSSSSAGAGSAAGSLAGEPA